MHQDNHPSYQYKVTLIAKGFNPECVVIATDMIVETLFDQVHRDWERVVALLGVVGDVCYDILVRHFLF